MSDFLQFSRDRLVTEAIGLVKNFPLRNGDIDESALGMSLKEFVQREGRRLSTPVELIEAFVNSRGKVL